MTLNKSDKLIAIIGVIILIVAAVGIYLYAGVEEDDDIPKIEEKTYFEITYEEMSSLADPENQDYSVKGKILGTGKWETMVDISKQNLKSVDVFIEYSDTKVGFLPRLGIIKSIGADSLTLTVYDSSDNEIGSTKIKTGNDTINIMSGGPTISMEPIEVEDPLEAQEVLEERYIDYSESYKIKVSLKTGLWGKIRERLMGKDNFHLEITYSYYKYDIVETGQEDEPDGDDDLPPTGGTQGSQTWTTMAFPGKN
jgi:hypothetical protein